MAALAAVMLARRCPISISWKAALDCKVVTLDCTVIIAALAAATLALIRLMLTACPAAFPVSTIRVEACTAALTKRVLIRELAVIMLALAAATEALAAVMLARSFPISTLAADTLARSFPTSTLAAVTLACTAAMLAYTGERLVGVGAALIVEPPGNRRTPPTVISPPATMSPTVPMALPVMLPPTTRSSTTSRFETVPHESPYRCTPEIVPPVISTSGNGPKLDMAASV